jgi:hypothetical protein
MGKRCFVGSGPLDVIGRAELIVANSREKPAGRVGIPYKGFDAGVRNDKLCAWDRHDLHGLLCRKILEDSDLPAVSLRLSAQILATRRTKSRGPDPKHLFANKISRQNELAGAQRHWQRTNSGRGNE